jgi:hypothetical protein
LKIRAVSLFALLFLLFGALSTNAAAQRGGSGGGGGGGSLSRGGGRYNLTFDYAPPIDGVAPRCVGSYSISTYVTTLNVTVKASRVNLPDNTPLAVLVEARDYYTGMPWPTIYAGTAYVTAQNADLTVLSLYVTSPGGLPNVTRVSMVAPDGTVIVSGHP